MNPNSDQIQDGPSNRDFDVVAIGHAIVDVLAHVSDADLLGLGMAKGGVALVDKDRATELYEGMGSAIESSGGAAANTAAGVASLGGKAAFVGRVSDDQLGEVFTHDIRAAGVESGVVTLKGEHSTGRSLIFITPDAQRTMNTYLGSSAEVSVDDLDKSLIEQARWMFVEGFLWDSPSALAAVHEILRMDTKIALTACDQFLIQRHRADLMSTIDQHVDVLFANEVEILELTEAVDFGKAVDSARSLCETVVITRSEQGSVILSGDETHVVPAAPVGDVVDTTGAGDLYAGGFLFGLARGMDLEACARIGSIAAAEVISHIGARPVAPLSNLI